jgi:hypothetical protein
MRVSMTDMYGFGEADREQLRGLIESALGIQMEAHESLYRGGDYYLATLPGGIQLSLDRNLDLYDGSPRYEEWPEVATLLLVSVPAQVNAYHDRLSAIGGIRHLRRSVLTPEGKLSIERIE